MSKITKYEAVEVVFRIPVEDGRSVTFGGGVTTEKKWTAGDVDSMNVAYRKAEALGKAILRTLGPYEDNVDSYEPRIVSEEVCGHCGYRWSEKSSDYNGGCCDEDQVAEDERAKEDTACR